MCVTTQRADELQKEDEARRAKLAPTLDLGKEAYACGEYAAAVKLLEKAVEEVGPDSQLGGEAQLWLALAYQVRHYTHTHTHTHTRARTKARSSCGSVLLGV